MSKVMPYLGAGLAALAMAWSTPSFAQDQFKDLDPKHWAYEAVTELQQKGILLGYPDGYFKGKRTLTRYEFAIALKRLLEKLPGGPGSGPAGKDGQDGKAGADGAPGADGKPGMTPEEIAALKKLLDEFKNELTSLGANVRDINNRLDGLAKDIVAINDRLNKMPKFGGNFFVGVRTDRSRFPYFDHDGAGRPKAGSNFSSADVVHDFHLTVAAPVGGGAKFFGDLMFSNYLSYRGGTLTGGPAAIKSVGAAGGSNYAEHITPYQANISVPVGIGHDGQLTIGRFENKATMLTYYRPDYDSYFDVHTYDNGNYIGDGIKLSTKFGSATSSIWATSSASVVSNFGAFDKPLIGTGPTGVLGGKPIGLVLPQIASNQNAGLNVGIPLGFGNIGVTAIAFSSSAPAPGAGLPYNTVLVYGANFNSTNLGKLKVNAEVAKSVTQLGFSNGDGQSNDDNNAYHLGVGYNTGPVTASAGYNYIDPRFSAPGYWMKIGNWINPTNVKGPFAKFGYKLSNSLDVHIGGDVLEGARNRPGYFVIDDAIRRVNAGLNYKVNHAWNTSLDYEGVFYSLSGATSATGVNTKPVEQYITLGAGVNLASNTRLKFGYQIINFQNVGGGFGAGTGIGGVGGGGNSSNASVFTTQVAVHF